jgi:4-carboxymuconolactone decarboxylase
MRLRLCSIFMITMLGVSSVSFGLAQTPDPRNVVLSGDRFKPLKYDEMTPEQKTMIDHLLAGERRNTGGPFNVLLRSPIAGDLVQKFGETRRFRTVLPKDVVEMVVIMTARFWTSQYEWTVHKAAALQNGVKPAIVDAIAAGKRPEGMSPELEVAYTFVDELLTTHQVTDATFNAVKAKFDERGVVDMVQLSGYYSMVAMLLNVDRYPLGQGQQAELKPMENPLPVVGMGFATPIPGPPNPSQARSTVNGRALTLRGDRLKALNYDQMTPEQKKLVETVLAGRGPGGSFNILLRSPESGEAFFNMGEPVRAGLQISEKLKELGISLTARFWGGQMEWLSHSRSAQTAGFSQEKLTAIAEGRRPTGMAADEEAVYNFVTELFKTREVSDATFAAARNQLGERGIVDLIVATGYYQIVSMMMTTDRLPLGAGQQPQLQYIARPLP